MKRILLALPLTLAAAELPVPQNVTGPYDLRIQADEPDAFDGGFRIEFWNRQTATLLGAAENTYTYGTASSAAKAMPVLWHGSGNYVAFTTRTTKHSTELAVYSLENQEPRILKHPNFVPNALRQVNATGIDLHCIATPIEWVGDDLHVRLYFSTSTEHRRLFYETLVVLHLEHGPNIAPALRLKSVAPPRQLEG